MKHIKVIIFLLFALNSFSQDYLGIYPVPNFTYVFATGTTSSVPTIWFSENTNQNTNQTSVGQIGVSASISGARLLTEAATAPATNPHPEAMIGGQSNDTDKRLLAKNWVVNMGDVGTPSSSYFKPSEAISGMDVNNHYAFEHYVSTEGLLNDNAPTVGRYAVGSITYTFTRGVNNPIFHVVGLGGFFSSTFGIAPTMLFSVDFDFVPNGQATSIQMLSGTSHTSLAGNTISNSYSQGEFEGGGTTGTSGNDAGSGSFKIVGQNITSVTFNLYMVGKSPSELWSTIDADPTPKYSGDRFNTTWTLEMNSLPVKLEDFSVVKKGENALISWKSSSEENFSHYVVEKSAEGEKFVQFAVVGGTGSGSTYSRVDGSLFDGFNYYRLKVMDLDGSYVYSQVKVINFTSERSKELAVFPNPFNEGFTISGLNIGEDISIYDITGKTVLQMVDTKEQNIKIDLSDHPTGIYNVLIKGEGDLRTTKILKIQ